MLQPRRPLRWSRSARTPSARSSRPLVAVAASAILALALTACGPQPSPRFEEGTSAAVAWTGEFTSLNAASTPGHTRGNLDVAAMTRGQFATTDETGEVLDDPSFGTATIASDDPFTVRYDLADGLRWSDGVPIDAADLTLAWAASSNALSTADLDVEALRSPDGSLVLPDDAVWFDVADPGGMVHATSAVRDDWARSLDVSFSQPIPDWRVAMDVAVPAHVLGQRVLGIGDAMEAKQAVLDIIDRADPLMLHALAEAWVAEFTVDSHALETDTLISSGPYRVDTLQDGRVELVANTDYIGERNATIQRIMLQPVAGDAPALSRLTAGELDVATIRPGVDDRIAIRDLERDDATMLDTADGTRWELALRTARAPLQSVGARVSFLGSIDRRNLFDTLMADATPSPVVTNSVLFHADARIYDYAMEDAGFDALFGNRNVDVVTALRDEAGIAAGTEVCVLYDRAVPFAAEALPLLQEQAAEAGWAVRDCGVDDLAAGLAEDNWNAVLRQVSVPESVEQIDERWRGGGITAAESAERDALLDEALSTADQDARESTLLELETSLVADAVVLPLVEPAQLTIATNGVQGVTPRRGNASLTWNAWEWSIVVETTAP